MVCGGPNRPRLIKTGLTESIPFRICVFRRPSKSTPGRVTGLPVGTGTPFSRWGPRWTGLALSPLCYDTVTLVPYNIYRRVC